MSDWNDNYNVRDGLPRGYVVASRDQLEPVAPRSWLRFDGDVGVQMAIELAYEHLLIVGRRDPMDVRLLADRHQAAKQSLVLPGRSHGYLDLDPNYDAYARPRAIAAKVFRANTRERGDVALLSASVRGKMQEAGMHQDELRPPWLSTRDIDSGHAWPTRHWENFGSRGLALELRMHVYNPHQEAMEVELVVFYDPIHHLMAQRCGKSGLPRCGSGT